MVTIRGNGWRVLAPPSMAMPRVLALLGTRTRQDVGSKRPGCGQWRGGVRKRKHDRVREKKTIKRLIWEGKVLLISKCWKVSQKQRLSNLQSVADELKNPSTQGTR